jgi:hypothetical protein
MVATIDGTDPERETVDKQIRLVVSALQRERSRRQDAELRLRALEMQERDGTLSVSNSSSGTVDSELFAGGDDNERPGDAPPRR